MLYWRPKIMGKIHGPIKRGPLATLASNFYLFREAYVRIWNHNLNCPSKSKIYNLQTGFSSTRLKAHPIVISGWIPPAINILPLARQWKCNSWMPQNAVPNAGRQNGRMVVSFSWGFKEKVDAMNAYIKPLDLLDGSSPTLIRKLSWQNALERMLQNWATIRLPHQSGRLVTISSKRSCGTLQVSCVYLQLFGALKQLEIGVNYWSIWKSIHQTKI